MHVDVNVNHIGKQILDALELFGGESWCVGDLIGNERHVKLMLVNKLHRTTIVVVHHGVPSCHRARFAVRCFERNAVLYEECCISTDADGRCGEGIRCGARRVCLVIARIGSVGGVR